MASFDKIGGASLDRGVNGGPFGSLANDVVAAVNVRQNADAAEKGARLLGMAGLGNGLLQKSLYAAVSGKVLIDKGLGHLPADFELLRKTESAHAVNDTEVDGLRLPSEFGVQSFRCNLKHFAGGAGMDILIFQKCFYQNVIFGIVGQDAQFDLGIIGGNKIPVPARNESLTNFATFFGADGDILQVRVRTAQTPGGSHGLIVGGVNPSGPGVDQINQCIGIG